MARLPTTTLAPAAALASTAGALVSGVLGPPLLTALLLAVSVAADAWTVRSSPARELVLEQGTVGRSSRVLLRALAVAFTGVDLWTTGQAVAYAVVLAVFLLGHGTWVFCQRQLGKRHARPVRVRNIDVPDAGPRRVLGLRRHHWRREVPAELAVLLPSVLAEVFDVWAVLLLGAAAAVLMLALVAGPVADVLANRRARVPEGEMAPKLRPLQAFVHEHRPEVVLHLAGGATSAYQVNVWLRTLESLDQRVLLLLRDDELFDHLAPTTLPAACVVAGTDVMSLDLSCVTVALFPTHVGSNLHVLRLPTLMSTFIGHGDSDKNASVNPYGRVYDELWVAGEAGADRWRRAHVGIDEDQLVAVGRPQIAGVERVGSRARGPRPTLLYAPTWEGWNFGQEYSSVGPIGVRVVEAALAHPAGFRVIYKPHPLLGVRDPKVRGAHQRIVRLLAAADGDHEVVQGPSGRELFACFNDADALVTDISSVVSDFLASEKPYAVFDFSGSTREHFVAEYPSASASTVLGRDGSGVAEFLDVVGGVVPDEQVEARARLATYLIGPPEDRSLEPFARAVTALSARARAERAQHRETARG
ncbi:CDP-glycerol glycerophosphotransferase family protein [Solicola sp. PLA-1-18]|uniref:CDP-glycerol glycerophosphotransferase family protein n=1 Tax=Solicola sp. PLA-1-18 TaxID=3380532 RepID=UPI003B7D5933